MTLQDLMDKYPDFFPEDQCGFGCNDTRIPFIAHICEHVTNELSHYYKIKEGKCVGNVCAKAAPKGIIKFFFTQIKEKFDTPRFYYAFKIIKYADLPEEVRDWLDEEEYNKQVASRTAHCGAVVSCCAGMAHDYRLVPING